MPKLKPETAKARAINTTKAYFKAGCNQAELARQRGVHRSTINKTIARPAVQKALQEQINAAAKKVGINLLWLLKRYKIGAEEAKKIIGYLHQYKKDHKGNIEKVEPEEIISSDFVTVDDWATQRMYLRDIAEIMKWLKTNGNGVHIEQKNYVQIYRPEPYAKDIIETTNTD